jgi:hypothetical protein
MCFPADKKVSLNLRMFPSNKQSIKFNITTISLTKHLVRFITDLDKICIVMINLLASMGL